MAVSPGIPGTTSLRAKRLEGFAKQEAENPPQNFLGNVIFPDEEVDTFVGLAPNSRNNTLDAWDDDTVGLKTNYPEVTIIESEYTWELGMHARKTIIGVVDQMKMRMAQAAARGAGNAAADPQFNLETRLTVAMTGQNLTHAEVLKMAILSDTTTTPANGGYPTANNFTPIVIDTTTVLPETIMLAAERVSAAGKGPANLIAFGSTATRGAMSNAAVKAMLPTDAPKVLTSGAFAPLLQLPDGQANVLFNTAVYRKTGVADPIPMFDRFIWVGRVGPSSTFGGNVFGFNYWHPCDNGQRVFVYRFVEGSPRNVHLSIENFYRPLANDPALGVIIPVTLSTD